MLFYKLDSPSQFGAKLSGQRVLQQELKISPDDDDKYFVGFSGDELPTIYFVVPEIHETWANGLDNKTCVSDCIASFESEAQAHERANNFAANPKYHHAHFFKSKYHEQNKSLKLVLVSTSSK
jgi:hypothetical protein